jgi:hypothetical protein
VKSAHSGFFATAAVTAVAAKDMQIFNYLIMKDR